MILVVVKSLISYFISLDSFKNSRILTYTYETRNLSLRICDNPSTVKMCSLIKAFLWQNKCDWEWVFALRKRTFVWLHVFLTFVSRHTAYIAWEISIKLGTNFITRKINVFKGFFFMLWQGNEWRILISC